MDGGDASWRLGWGLGNQRPGTSKASHVGRATVAPSAPSATYLDGGAAYRSTCSGAVLSWVGGYNSIRALCSSATRACAPGDSVGAARLARTGGKRGRRGRSARTARRNT